VGVRNQIVDAHGALDVVGLGRLCRSGWLLVGSLGGQRLLGFLVDGGSDHGAGHHRPGRGPAHTRLGCKFLAQ